MLQNNEHITAGFR